MPVFKAITGHWETIRNDLPLVPAARAQLIKDKFNAVDQLREAAHYYALYASNPGWKELCVSLYRARETAAMQIARPHLQTLRGTCSMCNVTYIYVDRRHIILYNFHVVLRFFTLCSCSHPNKCACSYGSVLYMYMCTRIVH